MSSYDSDFVEWFDAKEKYEMANDAVTDENNDLCTWHVLMSLCMRVLHIFLSDTTNTVSLTDPIRNPTCARLV